MKKLRRLEPVTDIRAGEAYYLLELEPSRWYGFYRGKAEAVNDKRFAHRFCSLDQVRGVWRSHLQNTDFKQAKIVVWRRDGNYLQDVPAAS